MSYNQYMDSQLLQKVRHYQIPQAAIDLLKQHPPLMIAGASASGKDAVVEYIEQTSDYRNMVTHTTRPPRQGEINGQHYWFVSEAEMLKLVEDQAFIEIQTIHGETIYGTSLEAYKNVLDSGHKPLLVIDVQGIEEITRHLPASQPVFILPPSFEVWMERLEKRGHMSYVERSKRLRSAKAELEAALRSRLFMLVINHEIPLAARQILGGTSDPSTQAHNRELGQSLLDQIAHHNY